jgi:hypothetical protein
MRKLKQKIEGTVYRNHEVRAQDIINEEDRTIRISVSSEHPVLRSSFFREPWVEVLGHKRGEVDLTRLNDGAPLLFNHDPVSRENRIGVVESATIKDRRIEAVVRLSKRDDVDDIWQDIKDGILRNISVGYTINERTLTREGKGEPSEFRITDWAPFEVSAVSVAADPNIGIGRGLEDGQTAYRVIDIVNEKGKLKMFKYDANGNPIGDTKETRALILAGKGTCEDGSPYTPTDDVRAKLTAMDAPTATPAPAPAQPATRNASVVELDSARDEGVTLERNRVTAINEAFAPYPQFDAVRSACINDGSDENHARKLLLTEIGKDATPAGADATRMEAGEDSADKFRSAAIISLACRAGVATDDQRAEVAKTGLGGYTLLEYARRSLELINVNTTHLGKMDLVGRAFTSSDFPLILVDAANKSMLKGFEEAPETWSIWAQTGSLSDFKLGRRVNLSSFNDLELVNEDGEYKYGSFTESGETIQLATYGKLFAISRQAIINDDLGAFTRIPSAMGRSASRTVGDLAYGALTSNPVMGDGVALFAAAHNNLNESGAGGTPLSADAAGIAAIAAMRNAMALQSDASNSAHGLNIRPSYFLTPVALEDIARSLMTDTTEPGQANPGVRNQIRGLATVVSDPRLDADSAIRYYLAAGQQFDTIEVAFLDGNQSPMLEQQNGWSIDGTEFKVRIDVAAAPMEYRTWQRDDGA